MFFILFSIFARVFLTSWAFWEMRFCNVITGEIMTYDKEWFSKEHKVGQSEHCLR